MFFSESILSNKKDGLAQVWLAAHWEKKLSKSQFLHTNIQNSVGAIIDVGTAPMALRLSVLLNNSIYLSRFILFLIKVYKGQLLLGVVRIFSRKTKYLLEDCNEALLKIKMVLFLYSRLFLAFKPGSVNLTEDQVVANVNQINLNINTMELDILLPEPTLDMDAILQNEASAFSNLNSFNLGSITIQEKSNVSRIENVDLGLDMDIDAPMQILDEGWNLNLMETENPDQIELGRDSIEVGRDAASNLNAFSQNQSMSLDQSAIIDKEVQQPDFSFETKNQDEYEPFGGLDNLDVGGFDVENNMPIEIMDNLQVPNTPQHNANDLLFNVDSPAQRVLVHNKRKNIKKRKLREDEAIELPSKYIIQQLDHTSDILVKDRSIPLTETMHELLNIDDLSPQYYFNSVNRISVPFVIRSLYGFNHNSIQINDNSDILVNQRIEDQTNLVENQTQHEKDNNNFQDESFMGGFGDDMNNVTFGDDRINDVTFGEDISAVLPFQPSTSIINDFDPNVSAIQSFINENNQPNISIYEVEEEELERNDSPTAEINKSTQITINLLHEKMKDGEELVFPEIIQGVSRSDAARFFFELLVLKTKDMIDVRQDEAFGDISIIPI